MKSLRQLSLLLIHLLFVNSNAQTYYGKVNASDSSILKFGEHVCTKFGDDFYVAVQAKNIQLYPDADSKNPLAPFISDSLLHEFEWFQIINPDNPDDPYDLIDTLIPYQLPLLDFWRIEIQKSGVLVHPVAYKSYFVMAKDFQKTIEGKLIYTALLNSAKKVCSGRELINHIGAYYDSLQWRIYKMITDQKFPSYQSFECRENELKFWNVQQFCVCRENFQVINPMNPEDPFDLIDTVVSTLPDASFFKGISYGINSNINGKSKLHSIALTCSINSASYSNRMATRSYSYSYEYAWVRWKDIKKSLSKDEAHYVLLNYVWTLTQ